MKNTTIFKMIASCFLIVAFASVVSAQTAPPANGGGNGNVTQINDDDYQKMKMKHAGINFDRNVWMLEQKLAAEKMNPTGDNAKIQETANNNGMPTELQAEEYLNGLFTPTGNVEADLEAYAAAKQLYYDNYKSQYDTYLSKVVTSVPVGVQNATVSKAVVK